MRLLSNHVRESHSWELPHLTMQGCQIFASLPQLPQKTRLFSALHSFMAVTATCVQPHPCGHAVVSACIFLAGIRPDMQAH